MAFDVPLGCSGFVYGLGIAGNIVSQGFIKKALLLVGNTQSVYASPEDKSTALLFGDAGSAIALEFDPSQEESIKLHYQTDGSGFENLIVPDGGCRHPFNEHSADMEEFEEGIRRTRLHEKMDGGAVFTFAFFNVPKSLKALMTQYSIDIDTIDYLLLHQANKYMCEGVQKKMKMPEKKVPFNIDRFGNTSGTSIPLLMVTELKEQLRNQKLMHLGCGFGVGLSLGSVCFCTDHIIVPDLIEITQ
jgi:3-oxoacyl-[acyl-carrier-protein] synthase-3